MDWPHKSESKSVFPPKGYAFLIFDKDKSIQDLMNNCTNDSSKFYISISSPSIKDKPVRINYLNTFFLALIKIVYKGSNKTMVFERL